MANRLYLNASQADASDRRSERDRVQADLVDVAILARLRLRNSPRGRGKAPILTRRPEGSMAPAGGTAFAPRGTIVYLGKESAVRFSLRRLLVIIGASVFLLGATARAAGPPLVGPTSLQPLLPSPEGWTKIVEAAQQVTLSDCEYTFASTTFARDLARIKVTLADSGGAANCLQMLTPMIALLPENHQEKIAPATVLSRASYAGLPAAERWDGAKNAGDIEVLVDGRFALTLEGLQIAGIDALREIVKLIDVKKVAGLK
jgi:hypothetical protein